MTSEAERQLQELIDTKRAQVAELEAAIDDLERALAVLQGQRVNPRAPGRRRAARTTLILEVLAEAGDAGMTRAELADALGETTRPERDLLSNGLAHLKRQGKVIRRESDGRWALPR